MATITYDDKVAINVNPDVADINKIKAEDMNEIKSIVNGNDLSSGIDSYSFGTDGYIRYNNGFQIAWVSITITGNFTAWAGSVYYLNSSTPTDWAVPFTTVYSQSASAGGVFYWTTWDAPTTTTPGMVRLLRINAQNNANVPVVITAYGKWK